VKPTTLIPKYTYAAFGKPSSTLFSFLILFPHYIVTVASIPQLLLLLFGALHHPSLVKYLFTLSVPNKTLTPAVNMFSTANANRPFAMDCHKQILDLALT
jgi:hypothetical protein